MHMSKFLLYFGIFLASTGFGTVPGIILIIMYFWADIKQSLGMEQNQLKSNNPNYYDPETMEKMR